MIGTPDGTNGTVASAISAPPAAVARSARPLRSRGQISARNAAGPTTSRPRSCGEPNRPASSAPASVARFQVRYSVPNVAQNAVRLDARSGWAVAIAVVSSMTPIAASSRAGPRTASVPASRSAYSVFRLPSSTALATPAARLPPAAMVPASANCEAPVNASRLSAQAWPVLSPEPTAAAP